MEVDQYQCAVELVKKIAVRSICVDELPTAMPNKWSICKARDVAHNFIDCLPALGSGQSVDETN